MNRMDYHDKVYFGGNRKKALERDNYTCVKCGMTNVEHILRYKYSINVDHIDGNGVTKPKNQRNNLLSNLQTLCISCHMKKDNRCAKLTHCKKGHPFNKENTRYRLSRYQRICRICEREDTYNRRKNNPILYGALNRKHQRNYRKRKEMLLGFISAHGNHA